MPIRRTRTPAQVATGLGAIGLVTAVGLAGTVAPAAAASADATRPLATGTIPTLPRENDTDTYTVRAGDTVSAIATRFGTTVSAIVQANGLDARARIAIGQVLTIPSGSAAAPAPATPDPAPAASQYTVVSGDTLSAIASRHGTTVSALTSLNGLTSTVIFPGQTLAVTGGAAPAAPAATTPSPSATGGSYTVRSGDTVSAIAAQFGTTVSALVQANGLNSRALIRIGQVLTVPGSGSASPTPAAPASTTPASTSQYTVTSGDTLSGIATSHGTTVSAITSLNSLSSTVIHPGQVLTVSGSPTSTSSTQEQLVPNTFLHYTYADDVVAAANQNKHTLLSMDVPSASQMQEIIRSTAISMGVDPALALAVAHQESGFDAQAVSPANAIGAMQVIPTSGEWASDLVGYELDLLDPHDNAVAGVAILRYLVRNAPDLSTAIGGYYQGLGSVTRNGLFADTRRYVANIQTLMTRYA